MMVLKQHYPEEKVEQFLELQLEKYQDGKRREPGVEPTLALVENQKYIYYAKGALHMFELQKAIGEDQLNMALKQFIDDWNTHNGKMKKLTNRYATSKDLLNYFRDVTPDDKKYMIIDLFETVD
nr:hypothetical protein [uncultured Psychroserpens sp.]